MWYNTSPSVDLNRALGEATLKDLSETENDDTWGTVFGNVKYIFTCIFRVLVFLKWHNIHHCDIKGTCAGDLCLEN